MSVKRDQTPIPPTGMSSIATFCQRNQLGRTTVYAEIAAGRLRALKIGRLTRITDQAEAEWKGSLPSVDSSNG